MTWAVKYCAETRANACIGSDITQRRTTSNSDARRDSKIHGVVRRACISVHIDARQICSGVRWPTVNTRVVRGWRLTHAGAA
jgi:hypothetical protein